MVRIRTLLYVHAYTACLLGVAPLLPYLDLPVQMALPAALGTGIILDLRRQYALPGYWGPLVAISCFMLYALQVTLSNLIPPVVNILALLLAVRLITKKTDRHILQIFVLALFALAASSLLNLSSFFFVYLVLMVAVVTMGLVLLSFHQTAPALCLKRPQLTQLLSVTASLPVVSLVLMLVFFVILPRTHRPLWDFLNSDDTATVGLSDKVQPGAFASTAATKTVALRIECRQLAPEDLYWRGIVLNHIEANSWIRIAPPQGETSRASGGQTITQTIYPEPKSDARLVSLDAPRRVAKRGSSHTGDLVFSARRAIDRRTRFEAVSVSGGVIENTGAINRAFYRQVPPPPSPRVAELAERLRDQDGGARQKILNLKQMFRDLKLNYATTDLPTSADPVDEFLFVKKRGYCEFFASSFAVILRLSGVPTRLVGGYYGGEYNELGGYYLVTEGMAHVWVEALTEEGQWLRIDPSSLAKNAGDSLLATRGKKLGWLRRVTDAFNYFWNRVVITYDLGRQMELLRGTTIKMKQFSIDLDWQKIIGWALPVGALGVLSWAGLRRRVIRAETRILRRYLHQVQKRYGLQDIPPTMGLQELAEHLDDPLCRKFGDIYGGAVYRDRQLTADERNTLEGIIRQLGQKKRPPPDSWRPG